MAAVVFAVGHERTITNPQAVAHAGAERAKAGLWPASGRLDVKMEPVSAGASLSLLLVRWGGNEVGATGSFLYREEKGTMAATVRRIAPVPLSSLPHNMETQGAIQEASVPLQRRPLLSISPLILGVHGEEAKHHQVQEGPNNSEPHQDIHEAECHVGRLLLEILLFLQGHKVSKADSGERDEAVVVSVEEAPSLKMGEGCSPDTQCSNAGQEAHQDHVLHGHLRAPEAQALLCLMQKKADECVHPFTQALEHDQSERNAQHRVEHAEDFSCVCAWRCVSIT